MHSMLSHSWSGVFIALLFAMLAALFVLGARRWLPRWSRFIGYTFLGLAGLTTVGTLVAVVRIGSIESKYPPMGKLIDVGGYRMHLLAEGAAGANPTVIWIPGGHGAGLGLYHLHVAASAFTRSILFDRPGTGWSDTGPFPRTTAREAEELATLLKNAGENGPFIVVGHSYGGLLAANFARRHPEKIAAVVLLDATPPDHALPGGSNDMVKAARMQQALGLTKLLGFQIDIYEQMSKSDRRVADAITMVKKRLGDAAEKMLAIDAGPAYDMATASIYSEWAPDTFSAHALDLVVYDGELGDLPVFVMVPQGDFEKAFDAMKMEESLQRRSLAFLTHMRKRYLATSSRSTLVYAPAGSTHQVPYEHPEAVINVVRQALQAHMAPMSGAP